MRTERRSRHTIGSIKEFTTFLIYTSYRRINTACKKNRGTPLPLPRLRPNNQAATHIASLSSRAKGVPVQIHVSSCTLLKRNRRPDATRRLVILPGIANHLNIVETLEAAPLARLLRGLRLPGIFATILQRVICVSALVATGTTCILASSIRRAIAPTGIPANLPTIKMASRRRLAAPAGPEANRGSPPEAQVVDAGRRDHDPSPGVRGAGLTPGVRGAPVVSQRTLDSPPRAQAALAGPRRTRDRRLVRLSGKADHVVQAVQDGLREIHDLAPVPVGHRSPVNDSALPLGTPTECA